MLTPQELARVKYYADLIQLAGGTLELLAQGSREDLKQLLEKWLAQTEEQPPEEKPE